MKNKILAKSLLILEKVSSSSAPTTLKSIVEDCGINYATASRICSDLSEMKLFEKCGYRHYTPGPGLIRLGNLAQKNSAAVKSLISCLEKYQQVPDTEIVFYNWYKGEFSLIYSDNNLPPLLKKYTLQATAALLWSKEEKLPVTAAMEKFIHSFPGVTANEVAQFKKNYESVKQQNYLISRHKDDLWSIVCPLTYLESFYGLGVCGGNIQAQKPDELYYNFSLLVADLAAELEQLKPNNIGR